MSSEIIPDSTSAVIIPPDARSVVGYEGFYSVTKDGRVYSHHRNRWLKPSRNRPGYLQVILLRNGVLKSRRVHRLVAQAFIPNSLNLPEINHIDGDKANNRVSNLEWCDSGHNQRHARDVLGNPGGTPPRPVLGIHIASGVRLYMPSTSDAARFVKGSQGTICSACQGQRNHHKGYRWQYLDETRT